MFEPQVPESKLYPADYKEMVGKEEWVAEKAMEVRSTPKLMYEALLWDGEQTGTDEIYGALAEWTNGRQFFNKDDREIDDNCLLYHLQELAERYAEYVLLPAHIEKMKNGNFEG